MRTWLGRLSRAYSNLSLTNKFIIPTMVVIFISFLVFGFYFIHDQRSKQEARLHDKAERISYLLLSSNLQSVWNVDLESLKKNCQAYFEDEEITRLVITDTLYGDNVMINLSKGISGTKDIIKTVDFLKGGQKVAKLEVAFSNHLIEQNLTQIRNNLIGLSLFLFILMVGIFVIVSQIALIPLRGLMAGVKHLTAGDLNFRIRVQSHDELGKLAVSFNRMAYELNVYQDHLQELVDQQTRELTIANEHLHQEITERKRTEEKLADAVDTAEQLLDEAQAANRAKSEFVANMSHEVRTPLNAIIGMTNLALRIDLSPKLRDYLTKIHASSQSLVRIVDDILDFSKIEAGRMDLESVRFDLRNVISNMSDVVCASDACSDVEFLISVDPDVPFRLVGDPLRLEQVLTNLASNAVKFTYSGEVLVKVERTEATQNGVSLKFSVRDTGIGILAEQIPRLFSSFTQADGSTTRKFGGSGLGLTICKRLVELMGGTIQVQSEPGMGSVFSFQLQFAVQPDVMEDHFEPPVDMHGMRVLVVDDNATSQDILLEILKSFSFKADAVESGEEAIRKLISSVEPSTSLTEDHKPYDLILLDWKLPGMNGLEMVQRIVSDERLSDQIPKIIMITALGTEEIKRQVEEAGLDGFLSKPVQPSLLLDIIMDVFGRTGPSVSTRTKTKVLDTIEAENLVGVRILVVEDNEINQQVAREILESAGVAVQIAWNGNEALEAVKETDFDAVLMDIQMPEMDGYEATRAIRSDKRFEDLPIIAMTAHAMAGDREKCMEAGMNDHLAKPVNTNGLIAVLSKWIQIQPKEHAEDVHIADEQGSAAKTDNHLPKIVPGIDIQAALKRLEGNSSLIKKLLQDFAQKYVHTGEQIKQALNIGSTEQAEQLAHTIKGVAGAISANTLGQAASDLEVGIKRNDRDACQRCLERFEQALAEVIGSISNLQTTIFKTESTKISESDTAKPLDLAQVTPILKEMAQLLMNFDVHARNCFYSLRPLLCSYVDNEDLELLERSVEKYEYVDASKFLKQIADHLGVDLP